MADAAFNATIDLWKASPTLGLIDSSRAGVAFIIQQPLFPNQPAGLGGPNIVSDFLDRLKITGPKQAEPDHMIFQVSTAGRKVRIPYTFSAKDKTKTTWSIGAVTPTELDEPELVKEEEHSNVGDNGSTKYKADKKEEVKKK